MKEETRRLLESADSSTSHNGNGSNSMMKIMEKETRVFVVDNMSARMYRKPTDRRGMAKPIESNPFTVGGYSFTIQLFTDVGNHVSLFIKNHSGKTAHVVLGLHIQSFRSFQNIHRLFEGRLRRSSFHDRETYHQVAIMEPGQQHGTVHFASRLFLRDLLRERDCIMITATIGLVSDHHQPPPPPLSSSLGYEQQCCILFKVGDRHYYAQESVITTRCPTLLSEYSQSDHIVVISDVDNDVFEAVLWFLHHNNMLHEKDRKAIANSNDDSFALKMLAAADKFRLKDLRRQCQSFVYYGDSEVLDTYYRSESIVKELWGNVSRLPKKMEEVIPQKMKAA
ncbi:hypothetical protein OROHE_022704 [Orobanche hederae]